MTGSTLAPYGEIGLAALRGHEEQAEPLIQSCLDDAVAARGRHRGEHGAVGPRRAVQRPRPVRGSRGGGRARPPPTRASSGHPSGRSPSSWRPGCAAGRTGRRAAALEQLSAMTRASGTDWALGIEASRRALLRDGRHRGGAAPRGDRAAGPHPGARRARPRTAPLRRMAAAGRPTGRRPGAAADRARGVDGDGRRGVRRPRAARATGHRRDGAQADGRDVAGS